VAVVRWLLDNGAAINEQDEHNGCTALWFACHGDHPPVVRLLLERGANPTVASGKLTALMIASERGFLEVVRLLLGRPTATVNNTNNRNDDGWTALFGACFIGHAAVARALLESGADLRIARNDGTTPTARQAGSPLPLSRHHR
jgi:ankyrin repeat protein